MAIHDRYLRRTPFERFLPDPDFPGRHFDAIGRPAFLLETPVVRTLVETEPWEGEVDGDAPDLPASSYLQLPQHLVWARTGDGGPGSVDGFFRTVVGESRMHLLPVVGLLEGRPGFTVLPLPGLPLTDAPTWATAEMRHDGEDFASEMPGSELERLYEVQTAGEVLKLVARATSWLGPTASARSTNGRSPAGPARSTRNARLEDRTKWSASSAAMASPATRTVPRPSSASPATTPSG